MLLRLFQLEEVVDDEDDKEKIVLDELEAACERFLLK
jgi:hypothetical protein